MVGFPFSTKRRVDEFEGFKVPDVGGVAQPRKMRLERSDPEHGKKYAFMPDGIRQKA